MAVYQKLLSLLSFTLHIEKKQPFWAVLHNILRPITQYARHVGLNRDPYVHHHWPHEYRLPNQ